MNYVNMRNECRLNAMLELREKFMRELADKRPAVLQDWPVDISKKESQQTVRDTVLKGVEEIFESLTHIRGWKPHRLTEISDFDKNAFLEEYVDAFNYFFSVLVMLGVSPEEFFEAYLKKDRIIHDRLKKDY